MVTPGYARTVGLSLLRGRALQASDDARAAKAVLVNAPLAEMVWPGDDPLGKRLVVDMFDNWEAEVVGLVDEVRHHGLASPTQPEVYLPYAQVPVAFSTLVVQGTLSTESTAMIREAVRQVQPAAAVSNPRLLSALVDRSIATQRLHAFLFGSFGLVALLLAGVGTFALTSFWVSRQDRNMGIRAALGASPGRIRRVVLQRTGRLLLSGLLLGLLASAAFLGGLSSLLHNPSHLDPAAYLASLLNCGRDRPDRHPLSCPQSVPDRSRRNPPPPLNPSGHEHLRGVAVLARFEARDGMRIGCSEGPAGSRTPFQAAPWTRRPDCDKLKS